MSSPARPPSRPTVAAATAGAASTRTRARLDPSVRALNRKASGHRGGRPGFAQGRGYFRADGKIEDARCRKGNACRRRSASSLGGQPRVLRLLLLGRLFWVHTCRFFCPRAEPGRISHPACACSGPTVCVTGECVCVCVCVHGRTSCRCGCTHEEEEPPLPLATRSWCTPESRGRKGRRRVERCQRATFYTGLRKHTFSSSSFF